MLARIRLTLLTLTGAVAFLAVPRAAAQEPTRYRLLEGTVLTFHDSGGGISVTPLAGTFDLWPDPLANQHKVLRFRGFSPDSVELVRGGGTYQNDALTGYQRMQLDVSIWDQLIHMDSGLVLISTLLPMIEIEVIESPSGGDSWYQMHIIAAPATPVLFTSEVPFSPGRSEVISDGDMLSTLGYVIRTNAQLTADLGIEPPAPDVGLDALYRAIKDTPPGWEAWFSSEVPVFSETLGWLSDGDLLSESGWIVARAAELLANFVPMPPADYGLDAITWGWPCQGWYFSTEWDFFSQSLGQMVGHGDVLCARDGFIFMRNVDLLARFHPVGPLPPDLGLDGLYMWQSGHIWFSLEEGFTDAVYGAISDGDLLSTDGWVIMRNADLTRRFAPPTAAVGLDGVDLMPIDRGDMNGDGSINGFDIDPFVLALTDPDGKYYALFPEIDPNVVGDVNYDGSFNGFDIDRFVEMLTGG
ncbi:MAG: hypothetical protein CHACPFDD_03468 [Phycisphaerae bacterium]|nr:hypothetical protein [Phycisphaerae bacterium]